MTRWLLLLLAVFGFAIAGVAVLEQPQRIAVLEVHAYSAFPDGPCDPGAPPEVFIHMRNNQDVLVGEERMSPVTLRGEDAVAAELARLKNARPDRQVVIIAIEDLVPFSHISSMVDALQGTEIKQVEILTNAEIAPFTRGVWERPPYREL